MYAVICLNCGWLRSVCMADINLPARTGEKPGHVVGYAYHVDSCPGDLGSEAAVDALRQPVETSPG